MSRKHRRKGKGGRPRLPGVREPAGRLSRKAEHVEQRDRDKAEDAMAVAIEARMRQTGLSRDICASNRAGEPNPGDMHGRLFYARCISQNQWDAAEFFLGARLDYLRSIQTPGDARPTGLTASSLSDEQSYEDWCDRQRARWRDIMDCLQEESIRYRSPIIDAFDKVLVQGYWLDHMLGDVRVGLNAIHRRFKQDARRAA